jgi:hypothetical protein
MGYISPATCVSYQDSPLSTAASIVGMMTFAYGVLVGIWFYLSSGTEALATSPQQYYLVLKEVRQFVETILDLDDSLGTYPSLMILETVQNWRSDAIQSLMGLTKWMDGGKVLYQYLADQINTRPDLDLRNITRPNLDSRNLTHTQITEIYALFQKLANHQEKTQLGFQIHSLSGNPIKISPNWIIWTVRYRWNQKPLMRALERFKAITNAIKEKQQEIEREQNDRNRR